MYFKSVILSILFLFVVITCLYGSTPSNFERQKERGWIKNGEPVPDTKNIKSKNGFGAQLWILSDDSLFKNWDKPETPNLNVTDVAYRNKPVFLAILFINPGVNSLSKADVSADITITSPNGEIYGSFKDVEIWKREYQYRPNIIQLGIGSLGIMIEDDEQLGVYKINAIISDRIKNLVLKLETEFTAKN